MWSELRDIPDRVRNMVRRGYLLATYNDRKLLTARVRVGADDEQDRLDVMQPVGFSSHVAAGPGVEILTTDVGSDASRRIVLMIIGDRANHPHPEEGEVMLYAPGDASRYLRIKQGGSSGRDAGFEISVGDLPVTIRSERVLVEANERVVIKAPIVELEGDVVIRGNLIVEGQLVVNGINFGSHRHGGVEPGGATTGGPV